MGGGLGREGMVKIKVHNHVSWMKKRNRCRMWLV